MINKIVKLFLFSLVVLLLSFFILPVKTFAFSISPIRSEVVLDQGSSFDLKLKIINDEDETLNFKLGVIGVKQDEAGRPIFLENIDDAESWIRPNLEQITLFPGDSEELIFNINVPTDIYPRLHYLGLKVDSLSESDGEIGITGSLVSLLALQVAGEATEELKIVTWGASEYITWNKNWNFDLSLKNVGNVKMPLAGKLSIFSPSGEVIYNKDLYLGNEILPDTIRIFKEDVNLINLNKIGFYKTRIDIQFGQTRQMSSYDYHVFFVPVWLVSLLSFVLAILMIFLFFIFSRKKK